MGADPRRRALLTAGMSLSLAPWLTGCDPAPPALTGGFAGADLARGHALRDLMASGALPAPARIHRVRALVAGGGVAGLAALRALRLAGVHDAMLLELEDTPGGNSRGTQLQGMACPQGAHYLPVPGDAAAEVQDLLESLGLRQRVAGRWQYDERHLCHSPQERLHMQGHWHEGLLPMAEVGEPTLAQYRHFAARVTALAQVAPFHMPMLTAAPARVSGGSALPAALRTLDGQTFAQWLDAEGLHDAHLRWYLDYCCRDDYGAGLARVSAWAGLHYFASRHGFHAPGDADPAGGEREGVLTWPEGNGWLSARMAAPLSTAGQVRSGCSVLRITEGRHRVQVDALDHASGRVERWEAERCVVALPLAVAQRVLASAPSFVAAAASRLHTAPWVVVNLALSGPLADRPGAAPAWDNVLYADATPGGLGYVDAGHQRLDPRPAPTVLSYYIALGDVPGARAQLAQAPWQHWVDVAVQALAEPHPDLRNRLTGALVCRYGHAMAVPVPGLLGHLQGLGASPPPGWARVRLGGERPRWLPTPHTARLAFAHSDWSGYSVFEEAFTRGHVAGAWASRAEA
ncbi:NAD(P)-binding protein [Acidovorax lacteus]|uniref:NAD(P)/FAD-dependent oxidoreductase n=1 Tax=Acidovorax lacteus TaxID=1924988 RepID=A0ABP8LCB4_9BURK